MIPKKSLGQHWLFDKTILQDICDVAGVNKDDVILEIGPGLGTLTQVLADSAREVVAVEFDEKLAAELKSRVPANSLSVIHSDILTFDLTQLPAGYKVVANIPYYLTSNLVRVLSETTNPPISATLLIQKEVAERLCARPGGMSLLSVSAQMYFEPSLGPVVPAKMFTPSPKIDSQVVHLKRRTKPLFGDMDPKLLFRIIKAGFSSRRKTLLNSLSGGLRLDKPTITKLLESASINPQARPQELSNEQWIRLAKCYTDL